MVSSFPPLWTPEGVYASVYRLRSELGQTSPRKHKVPQHRRRRERAAREGQLVQVDGSDHDWLEGRGPKLTLPLRVWPKGHDRIRGRCHR